MEVNSDQVDPDLMDGDKRYPTWCLSSIKMSSSWLCHTGSVMLHYCDWRDGGRGGAMMAAVMVTVMMVEKEGVSVRALAALEGSLTLTPSFSTIITVTITAAIIVPPLLLLPITIMEHYGPCMVQPRR